MNMYRRNSTCYITADEGQVEVETAAGRMTTRETTFSSNVVIRIVADGAGGVQESFLSLDDLVFLSDQSLLKTTGPFRFRPPARFGSSPKMRRCKAPASN
jgi:hypothetical protein